jgi:hypothetical protein
MVSSSGTRDLRAKEGRLFVAMDVRGIGFGVFIGDAFDRLGELVRLARPGDEKSLRLGLLSPVRAGLFRSCWAAMPAYLDARDPGVTAPGGGPIVFRAVGATGVFIRDGRRPPIELELIPGVMRPDDMDGVILPLDIAGVILPLDDTLDIEGVIRPYVLLDMDGVTRPLL